MSTRGEVDTTLDAAAGHGPAGRPSQRMTR